MTRSPPRTTAAQRASAWRSPTRRRRRRRSASTKAAEAKPAGIHAPKARSLNQRGHATPEPAGTATFAQLATVRTATVTARATFHARPAGREVPAVGTPLHRAGKLLRARVALLRVKAHGLGHNATQVRWHVRPLGQLPGVHAGRWVLPRQAEPQHGPQRIDVAPDAGLPKAELLRRGVAAGAQTRGVGLRALAPRASNPQVNEDEASGQAVLAAHHHDV